MASLFTRLSDILFGKDQEVKNINKLSPEQQQIFASLSQAAQGQGAGGAFGESADYYRDLLDPSGQAQQDFAAPAMRQFQEDILPMLAEQFAGMGSGGALSGSGFRNAATREASSLSERLAAMRAGLQQQGAAGLSGIGQQALGQSTFEPVLSRGTTGLIPGLAAGAGEGFGQAMGGGNLGKLISGYLGGI